MLKNTKISGTPSWKTNWFVRYFLHVFSLYAWTGENSRLCETCKTQSYRI